MACQYQVKGKPNIFGGTSGLLGESLWSLLSTKQCFVHKWNSEGKGMMGESDKMPFAQVVQRKNLFPGLLFRPA